MSWRFDDPFGSPNPHRLYRDPRRGRILGVFAGIADYFGIDPVVVRVAAVLAALFFTMPVLVGYLILGLVLKPKPARLYHTPEEEVFWRSVSIKPERTVAGLKHSFRDFDRRLAGIESCVTSQEFTLHRAFRDLDRQGPAR